MTSMWKTVGWMAVGLLGCPAEPAPRTCDDVVSEYEAERAAIQSCTDDTECGQVLTGTSCGCTRDLVARLDADTTAFSLLIGEAGALECDLGLASVCDCPATAGFRCDAGTCGHNYLYDYVGPPQCYADRGDPLTIDQVTLDGDDLVVSVSYSGGCAEHDIVLCWPDQAFQESEPVQAGLELFHEDNDDACDGIETEELRLSLLPLQAAWHEAYGSGPGTIIVHLGGFDVEITFL